MTSPVLSVSLLILALVFPGVLTAAGPARMVVDAGQNQSLYPDPVGVQLVVVGEHAYFAGYDGIHGIELWRTDATTEGTEMSPISALGRAAVGRGSSSSTRAGSTSQRLDLKPAASSG